MEQLKEMVVGEYTIEQKALNSLKSAVFMPERISFNSKDDSNILNNNGYYNQFTVNLRNPVLSAKTIDILKTTIPIITTNIPNSETTFWYYKLPAQDYHGNLAPVALDIAYLRCIRLQDSSYPREFIPSTYPINRYYNTYSDLLDDLNLACVYDRLNPYFTANDISFDLDLSANKFSFTGSDPLHIQGSSFVGFYYLPADANDPNVKIAQANLASQASFGNAFGFEGFPSQSYVIGRTLNTRLGFVNNYTGLSQSSIAFINQLRPTYTYPPASFAAVYTGGNQTAQSYANLVYSQNVNIYCNITAGSAYSSENGGLGNFLLAVPLNTTPLGVSYFTNTQRYPLKIPPEIYSLTFIFKTDTGLPFYFPVSENISIETGFTY